MSDTKQIDDGGTAFPLNGPEDRLYAKANGIGMSIRDYFAAKAMQSVISAIYASKTSDAKSLTAEEAPAFVADTAYEYADAMLEARKQ